MLTVPMHETFTQEPSIPRAISRATPNVLVNGRHVSRREIMDANRLRMRKHASHCVRCTDLQDRWRTLSALDDGRGGWLWILANPCSKLRTFSPVAQGNPSSRARA